MTAIGRRLTVLRGVGVHDATVRLGGGGAGPTTVERPEPVAPSQHRGGTADAAPSEQALALLRQQAEHAGYEEGLRQGLAAARQRIDAEVAELARQREHHEKAQQEALTQLQREQGQAAGALAQRFDALITEVRTQVAQQLQALERDAVDLAFQSLQKMLGTSSHRVEALRLLIEQQIGESRGIGDLRIHLNPVDLEALGHGDDVTLLHGEHMRIVPDARLPLGGCTVHSARGHLDVGLPTQLARLGQLWTDQLAEGAP